MRRHDPHCLPWWSLGGIALCLLAPLPAAAGPCASPGESARVAAVVDDLDLALEDGRTVRLAGLDPARATPTDSGLGERMRRTLAQRLVGREVAVAILAAGPDRWERYPAVVTLPFAEARTGSDAVSLNETLIRDGAARARPEAVARPCLARFLAGEAAARMAGLGLWSDPYYAILRADDRIGLSDRVGAMALVEGTARLREARGRVGLDLGRDRFGLAATVSGRDAKRLAQTGLDLKALVGARLRIRGFLDNRFGPRIEVTEVGQVEVIGDPIGIPDPPRRTTPDTVGQEETDMRERAE